MTNETEIISGENTLRVPEEVIGNGEDNFDIVDEDEERWESNILNYELDTEIWKLLQMGLKNVWNRNIFKCSCDKVYIMWVLIYVFSIIFVLYNLQNYLKSRS